LKNRPQKNQHKLLKLPVFFVAAFTKTGEKNEKKYNNFGGLGSWAQGKKTAMLTFTEFY
jgi:hypothetical protein